MLQTPGNPPVGAPSKQRERRPGVRCHPTRMLIGRSARTSGRGSDQDHHHLPNLLSHLRSQLHRRQTDKQNRTICEEVVTCQRQMTKSQRNQKRSSKLGCPCLQSVARDPHTPKRRREGDSPVSGDAVEKQFKFCAARGTIYERDHDHHLVRPDCVRVTGREVSSDEDADWEECEEEREG